ncbi:FAD-dependent oxidoreductase [Pseudoduganella sp. UC29_106]|uniref:FAD-dependent oxidoreductase n=1 Tax=Pseudoduganella sp. UC29_106 TaxID=3374553 RepID=UPI003756BF87
MSDFPHPPAPDLSNRMHQIFPLLNEGQMRRVARYGTTVCIAAGEYLYHQGERHTSMFVIVSGEIEVTRQAPLGVHSLGRHGRGLFTGDTGTLAGRASSATVRAVSEVVAVRIDEEAVRTLVVSEAELSELIMRAFILRRVSFFNDRQAGVIVIGTQSSASTLRVREFLTRNLQPSAYFDMATHEGTADIMARFGITEDDAPAVVTQSGQVLKKPTMRQLADAVGISADRLKGEKYDVVVVGAGPAGLASAVYGASEGLRVAVLDAKAPGGQAGASSRIENYFGFPTGISGQALAGRGLTQARKFGAEVAVPVEVRRVDCGGPGEDFTIHMDDGECVYARSIVIATGARYRKPDLPELGRYEGRGVYYAASFMEAQFCHQEEVVVVGGGNSAGQAAVFLASHVKHVHIMVRSEGLAASMSRYLIQRIDAIPNITLHTRSRIVELKGEGRLESIRCRMDGSPEVIAKPICHVFLFLGAEPNTGWLADCVALDDRDFVLTGPQIPDGAWPLERLPHPLETSNPGIFAVGDVRSGSVKRVAAAVGEGSAAIQSLHRVLAGVADA